MRLTETKFVELLRSQAARHAKTVPCRSSLRRGIGDDCAVIAHSSRTELLVTTDLFIEGSHFRREWGEPRSVGHKLLARGLSDIAAMGGTPRYVFLSLGLPPKSDLAWVNAFLRGLFDLATDEKVVLAGGDTGTSRGQFMADIIVMGEVPRGQAILRSGAQSGDEIWVTGQLGMAAHGLRVLEEKKRRAADPEALRAFFYPKPRIRLGRFLRERKLATAMMDLTDGLSLDLCRLCKESGVGARILESSIPRSAQTSLQDAIHGGEDLELLFTVAPGRAHALPRSIGGIKLTRIGQIISGKKLLLRRGQKDRPLPALGFQHF